MLKIKQLKLKFEPRDLWIGLFWDTKDGYLNVKQRKYWKVIHLYFTLVPTFPLFIELHIRERD